jgi:MinD-like ATPase involved in chromosome partitioning or flagellar assembly
MTIGSPNPPGIQLRVVLGVSRARVLPLRLAYESDAQIRVVASCTAAGEVLSALESEDADGAVVDEDLHGLNGARLAVIKERRWPVVLLSRRPEAPSWQGLAGPVLSPDADPLDILHALQRAVRGEYVPRRSTQPRANAAPATGSTPYPGLHAAQPGVIAVWSGRGAPGKTTICLNSLALGGAVEPSVLVELDTTAASLAAYLDDGRDGRPRRARSTLLELAGAQLRTAADWDRALGSTLQSLGPYSRHARLLCGIAHPEQRTRLTDPSAFVESLIAELGRRFQWIWLDLGSDPLAGESTEARIGTTSLRLADRVLVVATPEPASVHRTCMAVREAGHRLDREGVSLVVNRVDAKQHGDVSWISNAVGLPILATLPADDRAQQRAVAAAMPVVRDTGSRLRSPLGRLLEQLGTPPTADAFDLAHRSARRVPFVDQLRAAAAIALSTIGGSR